MDYTDPEKLPIFGNWRQTDEEHILGKFCPGPPSLDRPGKNHRAELTRLTHTIAQRVGRYLERQGLMERDAGNIFLTQEAVGLGDTSDEDPTNQLPVSSVTYRIAVGPQQSRKVSTLKTLPDVGLDNLNKAAVGEVSGFSKPG